MRAFEVGDKVRYSGGLTPDWIGLEGTIQKIEDNDWLTLIITKTNDKAPFNVGDELYPAPSSLDLVKEEVPVETPAEVSAVVHPAHYGGDTTYEAIKVIEAWGLGFHLGNTVKYISRAGKKDKHKLLEDLKKALWYLTRKIAKLEEELSTSI